MPLSVVAHLDHDAIVDLLRQQREVARTPLAGALAILGRLDPVIERVTQQVDQRRPERGPAAVVESYAVALGDDVDAFAEAGRQTARLLGETRQARIDRIALDVTHQAQKLGRRLCRSPSPAPAARSRRARSPGGRAGCRRSAPGPCRRSSPRPPPGDRGRGRATPRPVSTIFASSSWHSVASDVKPYMPALPLTVCNVRSNACRSGQPQSRIICTRRSISAIASSKLAPSMRACWNIIRCSCCSCSRRSRSSCSVTSEITTSTLSGRLGIADRAVVDAVVPSGPPRSAPPVAGRARPRPAGFRRAAAPTRALARTAAVGSIGRTTSHSRLSGCAAGNHASSTADRSRARRPSRSTVKSACSTLSSTARSSRVRSTTRSSRSSLLAARARAVCWRRRTPYASRPEQRDAQRVEHDAVALRLALRGGVAGVVDAGDLVLVLDDRLAKDPRQQAVDRRLDLEQAMDVGDERAQPAPDRRRVGALRAGRRAGRAACRSPARTLRPRSGCRAAPSAGCCSPARPG